MSQPIHLTTEEQIVLRSSERVLAKLPNGRFIVATFTAITPGEIERAHEGPPPPAIESPSFMDVVEACELIGQGACRPFAGLRQIVAALVLAVAACALTSCEAAWGMAYRAQGGYYTRPARPHNQAQPDARIGQRPEPSQSPIPGS